MAMQSGIIFGNEEATIALAAIYADTGRLLHENVSQDDYEVCAWLLGMGASLKLVKSFLETIKEDAQRAILNQLRPQLNIIQGNTILLSYLELEENVPGLAAVVEKIFDSQNPDAYFAVFSIPRDKTILLISRSQKNNIDLNALLSVYGGGGHKQAASAKISGKDGREFFKEISLFLQYSLEPPVQARDIMTKNVVTIHENSTLMDTSMLLERVDLAAVPVVDKEGNVTGLISLRDIMKGRKHGKMHASVKAYMSTPVISAAGIVTMREIEEIFYKHKISQIPIIDDGKLKGIVTRWDYLQYQKGIRAD
jgi:tRNA nucleotidyltransferase (CCA-adding enzyme)